MEIWEVVILCLLALFIGIAILMLTDVQEKIRRKKHPVWFKHYDRALKNSFNVGSKFRTQAEGINYRRTRIQEMFFNGECSADEYNDVMQALDEDYREVARQFSIEKESLGVLQDLKAADAYAREHNFKWGILYED